MTPRARDFGPRNWLWRRTLLRRMSDALAAGRGLDVGIRLWRRPKRLPTTAPGGAWRGEVCARAGRDLGRCAVGRGTLRAVQHQALAAAAAAGVGAPLGWTWRQVCGAPRRGLRRSAALAEARPRRCPLLGREEGRDVSIRKRALAPQDTLPTFWYADHLCIHFFNTLFLLKALSAHAPRPTLNHPRWCQQPTRVPSNPMRPFAFLPAVLCRRALGGGVACHSAHRYG